MAVHQVTWAPAAIESALAELIEVRDGKLTPTYLTACDPPMTLMCAIDCLRSIVADVDGTELAWLRHVEAAARAYIASDPPRPEWRALVDALAIEDVTPGYAESREKPETAFLHPDRRVVLIEGVPTTDGRLIRPGAITWPDGPLPLVKEPDGVSAYIGPLQAGHLVEVRREGALITAAVVLDGDPFPDFDWVPSADLTDVTVDNRVASPIGPFVFTKATLRGAHVLARDAWCWTTAQVAEAARA